MRIENLTSHRAAIDTLASWHFGQWGRLTGSETREDYVAILAQYAHSTTIPLVLVALSGAELLGSVSLVVCDMTMRADLTPWLAQLFVAPVHRNQRVGAALVRAGAAHAKGYGFQRVYLYTSGTLPRFYERLGWTVRERVPYLGKERAVMHYDPP